MSRKRKERKEKRKERKFMGKLISLTPEVKEHLRSEFEKYLDSAKCQDGKVQFIRQLDSVKDRKATVYLTPQAFAKMWALISNFNKEVAWHGLARRMEDETKDEYLIYDILVYPQEVTGTTVKHICHAQTSVWFLLMIALLSLLFCIVLFVVGRLIGRHYGCTVDAGQASGQKNTAFAIWIAYTYLSPLSSVGPGCYILWQNIVNSLELWKQRKIGEKYS